MVVCVGCLKASLRVLSLTLQQLKQTGVESMSARSEYVAIGPDGRKLTSSTGTSEWKHKDSKAKTHYSFNELTGEVESRVYNSEGTLVRYNGKHLGGEFAVVVYFGNITVVWVFFG
jgi:flagellar hook assembly protein FlgD